MTFLQVLPLAFVMVAGPQILSSFFFATSEGWRGNSVAYVAGSALSITLVVAIAFFLIGGVKSEDSSDDTIYWIVLALLLFAMVNNFRTRHTAEPPKWMGRLQAADRKFSFRLGFLLLGFFPSDLVTSVSVGSFLAAEDEPFWQFVPFLLATLLFLALPALFVAIAGERAQRRLPKIRDWMNDNSWIVNELVLVLFAGLVINSIATN